MPASVDNDAYLQGYNDASKAFGDLFDFAQYFQAKKDLDKMIHDPAYKLAMKTICPSCVDSMEALDDLQVELINKAINQQHFQSENDMDKMIHSQSYKLALKTICPTCVDSLAVLDSKIAEHESDTTE